MGIHYASAGRGAPLVLLHGWPQHWWSFRHVITPLAQHYRVICPDLRGLGWSGASPRGYRFLDLAADLVALLDALGIGRTRLVGHDWGAAVGYTACLQWPARFERFVALGSVTPWAAEGAQLGLYLRSWHMAAFACLGRLALRPLALQRRFLQRWRHVGRFTPDEEECYLTLLRRPESETATVRFYRSALLHEMPNIMFRHANLQLHTPTLHLNGVQDPFSMGLPDSYRRHTDDMQYELIPNCGHFIPEEQPALLAERLERFFA